MATGDFVSGLLKLRRRVLQATVVVCGLFQLLYLPLAARGPTLQPPPPRPPVAVPEPSPEPSGQARIAADPPSFDLGAVAQGQEVVKRVSLRNIGNRAARVARTWSTCGCTSALVTAQSLPAGAAAELEIRFTGRAPGPFLKSVFVVLDYPTESVRIDLTGTVSR